MCPADALDGKTGSVAIRGGWSLMANVNSDILTEIFVGATAFAVLLQAAILLALFIVVQRSVKKIHSQVEQLRTTAMPILDQTKEIVKNVSPKIDSVTTDLTEMVRGLRAQTAEVQASASDILERVHRQTGRVDTMFSDALDKVDRAGTVVNDAVSVPLKHLSGVAAFAKAAVESFRNNSPKERTRPTRPAGDKDFV
jgi:methyl-accepting chemotaxis protein